MSIGQTASGYLTHSHTRSSLTNPLTELGKNGLQVFASDSKYLKLGMVSFGNGSNNDQFGLEFRIGNHGIRCGEQAGFQKLSNGSWVT